MTESRRRLADRRPLGIKEQGDISDTVLDFVTTECLMQQPSFPTYADVQELVSAFFYICT